MAVDNQDANPIVVEPASSPNSRPPSSLHIPSLNTSSSSTSFDSSRPQSRATSATSPSRSPSPAPTDGKYDLKPLVASDTEPLPPSTSLIPNEQGRNFTTPSTTHSSQRPEGSLISNGNAWTPPYFPFLLNRRWLEHFLGIFGLVASLVGLLFIGVRTYKLAVITTENSTLDGCTGLIQVSDFNKFFGIWNRSDKLSGWCHHRRELDSAVQNGYEDWSTEFALSSEQTHIAFFAGSSLEMDEGPIKTEMWLSLHRMPARVGTFRFSSSDNHQCDPRIRRLGLNIRSSECKIDGNFHKPCMLRHPHYPRERRWTGDRYRPSHPRKTRL